MNADPLVDRIRDIAIRLLGTPNKQQSSADELRFGHNGSISVVIAGPKAGSWYDHERGFGGGPREFIELHANISPDEIPTWCERELGIHLNGRGGGNFTIVAEYDYRDEAGKFLFQVVRLEPKTFRQRKPDGGGGWSWKVKGTRQVLYRLPELHAAAEESRVSGEPWRAYIAEGEKDADRLRQQWGVLATCNPGGAGKWRSEYNQYFAGANVVILPDNDNAGREHARQVANNLAPIAASVRVVELGGLAEKGDVSDWIDGGGSQSDLETLIELTEPYQPASALKIYDAGDIDVTKIPPRGWLLGVSFCRKFISGLIGEGGVGKTAIRYAQYLAGAAGRSDITGEYVHHRFRTLIVCLEDDLAEVQRRIGAAMLHHNMKPQDVKGWLFYCTPRGLKLLVESQSGERIVGALYPELKAEIAARKIDIVSLDPFVKAHGVGESDNNAIDQVCTMLADLADEFNCAVDIPSHQRKGGATPGDAERDRGASAKKDAGRLVRTVTPMSPEEAKKFGLSDDERAELVRVDDAKVNIVRKSAQATWFRLVGVRLGNANPMYPSDEAPTVKRWFPPDGNIDPKIANQILDTLDAGPAPGRRYSPAPQANDRPAWLVVQEFFPAWSKKQCTQLIADWLKKGALRADDYHDPERRRRIKGLFVGTRPGSSWDV